MSILLLFTAINNRGVSLPDQGGGFLSRKGGLSHKGGAWPDPLRFEQLLEDVGHLRRVICPQYRKFVFCCSQRSILLGSWTMQRSPKRSFRNGWCTNLPRVLWPWFGESALPFVPYLHNGPLHLSSAISWCPAPIDYIGDSQSNFMSRRVRTPPFIRECKLLVVWSCPCILIPVNYGHYRPIKNGSNNPLFDFFSLWRNPHEAKGQKISFLAEETK